jgi:hypothetical protein
MGCNFKYFHNAKIFSHGPLKYTSAGCRNECLDVIGRQTMCFHFCTTLFVCCLFITVIIAQKNIVSHTQPTFGFVANQIRLILWFQYLCITYTSRLIGQKNKRHKFLLKFTQLNLIWDFKLSFVQFFELCYVCCEVFKSKQIRICWQV